MLNQGYLYIANGSRYVREAIFSAISLRKISKDAHITLITDKPLKAGVFDSILVFAGKIANFQQALNYKIKHLYTNSPYKKTFFLDSDTYFYADCSELFAMLDYFDVCIALAPLDRHPVHVDNKLFSSCPSYNTGVIVYKKNYRNKFLFEKWEKNYSLKLKRQALGKETDQTSFMQAFIKSNSKCYIVPNIFNVRIPYYINLAGGVKIIHGRHQDYKKLEKKINITFANRSWDPVGQKCVYREIIDRE